MDNIIERFRASLNEIMLMRDMDSVRLGAELRVDSSVVRRWCNKCKDIRLKTLIRLADYFQCSIEYLCGKTQENEEASYELVYPHFGDRLLIVMKELNIKPFRLFRETDIIPSKYYYWVYGGEPSLTSLNVLAEYFNFTLDYLVGRQKSSDIKSGFNYNVSTSCR